MQLTVYVPCYNGARTLAKALGAILEQTLSPTEILLIDDGSTDASVRIARRFADYRVRVLSQPCNRGLAATRNRALAESHGEILIGLDADVAPEPDFVACVHETFRTHPHVGAICGRLIESHTEGLADQWRAVHMCQDHGPTSLDEPPLLYGCTTAIRRSVAQRVGGWTERFRTAYEDVDLSLRLREAGIPTRYEAGCRAYHLRTDSVATVLDSFWRWHSPLSELAGHFESVARWIEQSCGQLAWQIFRERFKEDVQTGPKDVLPLTILLPWWMTACDLEELERRFGKDSTVAEIGRRLSVAACSTLMTCGAPREVADWIAEQITFRLRDATKVAAYFEVSPAATVAITRMCENAKRSLPVDRSSWSKVRVKRPSSIDGSQYTNPKRKF